MNIIKGNLGHKNIAMVPVKQIANYGSTFL